MDNFHCTVAAVSSWDPELEIVQLLIDLYQDGLQHRDSKGMLPLHIIVGRNCLATFPLLQLVTGLYPTGLRVADNEECLPFHHTCRSRIGIASLCYLLSRHLDTVIASNNRGWLPLHYACYDHFGINHSRGHFAINHVCLLLMESYRFSILQETNDGETPLWLMARTHHHILVTGGYLYANNMEALDFLRVEQERALQEVRQAFEFVTDEQLGLPDLVATKIWQFARPNLWEEPEDYVAVGARSNSPVLLEYD